MPRIIHFDITVPDMERASRFYEEAFGWKIQKWDGPMEYWLVVTGDDSEPGINGGLSKGEPNLKNGELTLDVKSVDEMVGRVTDAGGLVTREKSAIPGVGWLVAVQDTEGNVFGLMEDDPSAS